MFNRAAFGLTVGAIALAVASTPAWAVPLTSYVPIGDSITVNEASAPNQWADANPTIVFNNRSWGAQGLAYLASQLAAIIADDDASHVLFAMGANDLAHTSAAAFLAAYQAAAETLRAAKPGVVIGAMGVLPASETILENYEGFNDNADEVNAGLRAAVRGWLDFYVPIGDHAFFDRAAADDATKSNDGLHWTGSGGQAYPTMGLVHDAVMNPIRDGSTSTSPSAFSFTAQTNAELETVYTAEWIVTGLRLGEKVAVTGSGPGDFKRGHGEYGTSTFDVMNGDVVTARLQSSAELETGVSQTITIGGVSATFTVTTKSEAEPVDLEAIDAVYELNNNTTDPHVYTDIPFPAGRPTIWLFANTSPSAVLVDAVVMERWAQVGQYYTYVGQTELAAGNRTVSIDGEPYNHLSAFVAGALVNAADSVPGTVSKFNEAYVTDDPKEGDVAIELETGGMRMLFGRAQTGVENWFDSVEVTTITDNINGAGGFFVAKSSASGKPKIQQYNFGYQMMMAVGVNP